MFGSLLEAATGFDRKPRVSGEAGIVPRALAERELRAAGVADDPLVAAPIAEPGRRSRHSGSIAASYYFTLYS